MDWDGMKGVNKAQRQVTVPYKGASGPSGSVKARGILV